MGLEGDFFGGGGVNSCIDYMYCIFFLGAVAVSAADDIAHRQRPLTHTLRSGGKSIGETAVHSSVTFQGSRFNAVKVAT